MNREEPMRLQKIKQTTKTKDTQKWKRRKKAKKDRFCDMGTEGNYSRELVAGIADEHAGLPNCSISNGHTFNEL